VCSTHTLLSRVWLHYLVNSLRCLVHITRRSAHCWPSVPCPLSSVALAFKDDRRSRPLAQLDHSNWDSGAVAARSCGSPAPFTTVCSQREDMRHCLVPRNHKPLLPVLLARLGLAGVLAAHAKG
jgi:hypothetical protein